jgi:hypothetical protein
MDLNFLTELGNKLLEKPKFQKYLGDISASQLNNELSRLTSELKELENEIEASPSGIGVEPGETQEDSRLTREQRKQNRENKREQRKKDREKKRKEINEKIKKLKQKTIPRFEVYTIRGRIYDSQTAEPLKGVKVKVGIDQSQITGKLPEVSVGVNTPEALKDVLQTDIKIATDFKPYVSLEVLIPEGQNTTTDNDGYYTFQIIALVVGEEDENNQGERRELKSLLDLGLTFNKPGYLPNSTALITLDDKIKRDISTLGLFNIEVAAEKAKDDINNEIYLAGQKSNQLFLSGIEKIIVARKKSVQKVTNLLTQKLIPLLIGILITFGISKISQKNQAVCPPPNQLKDAIKKRNRAVRQINQVFVAVIINTGLSAVFLVLANSLRGIRLSIDSLPFPMAIGTPPAKDFGGLITSIRYNLIARLQRIDDLLEELEDQNKTLNKQLLITLAFLIAGLIIAKSLIKTADELVAKCAQDQIDSGEITLEELRDEIKQLEDENEAEGNVRVRKPFVNGFTLSVAELNKEVGSLKPRQAIAKNKDGVILLKGEPSFSATEQVLIDELVFYIKSNNLKAF